MKPSHTTPHPEISHARRQRFSNDDNIVAKRNENMELRREFFKQLSKPDFDQKDIEELMMKLEQSQRNLENSVLIHFVTLRNDMSNEEAEDFFGRLHDRYERRYKTQHKQKNK
jgi:hypothetical protein